MTEIRLADRMARLGTESAFEVLARARAIEDAGGKIIHLEIGEPDFPTAPHIVEAAVEALRAGHTHYVPAPGIPPLRQAVAAFLERTGRMRVPPDRVVVTPGAKPIMFFTILALAGPGDEVLYPDPGFPRYASITSFAGAVPVPVPLRESNGFRVFPPALVEPVTRLAINSVSCTSAFSQYAAIAALDGPQDGVAEMVAAFRRRRDVIVAGLNGIPGISCIEPQGAFYAFPNITGTGLPATELQARLLREAGVAALAGTAFGPWGEGFLRLSYANAVAT